MECVPTVSFLYKLTIGEYWYAGSSTQGVAVRLDNHYRKSVLCPTRKLYKHISTNGGWSKVKMEILFVSFTLTPDELLLEEDKLIKLDDPLCLNSFRAVLTPEERVQQKKEVSIKCKKVKYAENRLDPKWVEAEKERARELYKKQMEDPEYAERKRVSALNSYYRRKNKT